MTINKDEILFERGEDGTLLPSEVELEGIEGNKTVKVRPLTRGKLQEITNLASSDSVDERNKAEKMIILDGLVEPKLNEEELKNLKIEYCNAISMAIMSISTGMSQKELKEKSEEIIKDQDLELKKK